MPRPVPGAEDEPPVTLGETGQVYVTYRAAQDLARITGMEPEEARRRLTEWLLDAKRPSTASTRTGAENWRAKSRTYGWDIDVHVSREERLCVVVHVHARPYR